MKRTHHNRRYEHWQGVDGEVMQDLCPLAERPVSHDDAVSLDGAQPVLYDGRE
jgi:hypothetical protein